MTTNKGASDLKAFSLIVEALRPLPDHDRIRLLDTICRFFGLPSPSHTLTTKTPHTGSPPVSAHEPLHSEGPFSTDRSASPKHFILERQPKTDVERVACLGFYLTHFRDTPHFRTLDISKLNTEAAQPKFSNAHYAMNNAVTRGYLVAATKKGDRQLSAAGERFVELLPDREAARAAMTSLRRRRTSRGSAKPRKSTGNKP